jgi:2-amino-4-hydroxy-6-hydroxymethyldihydropteridine diphosphokinase
MKTQNTITLSLGTNMGHKLENLLTCIEAIHHTIATVIEVSKVYETPAWGFEGEAFYNCVVTIHTHKSASKILNQILKLEKDISID